MPMPRTPRTISSMASKGAPSRISRQAQPMQNRSAPASFAARARSSTGSTCICASNADTSLLLWIDWEQ